MAYILDSLHAINWTYRELFLSIVLIPCIGVVLNTLQNKFRHNRQKTTLRVLGMQGGNAVDGLDVCVVDVCIDEPPNHTNALRMAHFGDISFKCLAFSTFQWSPNDRELVLRLRDGEGKGIDYATANYRVGHCFADAAEALFKSHPEIMRSSVDLVSSHGQSVMGHPHWEIGDINVIATRLGITTVGDFRTADVAVGGNGSPCTCTFDVLFLVPPRGWRLCINIGGTTTITMVPHQSSSQQPVGLDAGIGVFFMDLNAQIESNSTMQYDDKGNLARSGKIDEDLLSEFLRHPHFCRKELPISIGAEDFPRSLFDEWRSLATERSLCGADLQATLTELTARSLALAAKRFGFGDDDDLRLFDVVIRGQVRKNTYFMERLSVNLRQILKLETQVVIKSLNEVNNCLPDDSWETCMYAIFGALAINGVFNFIPSITGASKAVVGGKIAPAENYLQLLRKLF
eukprot:121961_1